MAETLSQKRQKKKKIFLLLFKQEKKTTNVFSFSPLAVMNANSPFYPIFHKRMAMFDHLS
jgi:hypothetical protein